MTAVTHLYAPSAAWLTDAHRTEPCPECRNQFGGEMPGHKYGSNWDWVPCQTCNGKGIIPVVPQLLTAPHPIAVGDSVEYVARQLLDLDEQPDGTHWFFEVPNTTDLWEMSFPHERRTVIVGRSVVTACDRRCERWGEWYPCNNGSCTGPFDYTISVSPVKWYPTPLTDMACPSGRVPVPTLTESTWA